MDKIEKLLRKISLKDRLALSALIEDLLNKNKGLSIKKLQGGDFYRARKGKFRIIFHYNSKREVIIDSIKLRNEGTYKNI